MSWLECDIFELLDVDDDAGVTEEESVKCLCCCHAEWRLRTEGILER